MEIFQALRAIEEPGLMSGHSDALLVERVEDEVARIRRTNPDLVFKSVTVAQGLTDGFVEIRPVDALQRLARVTALDISDDIFTHYQWWARMRYLGAFDRPGTIGAFRLSGAAGRNRGNQRRVMSEELGVGFGVLLAERWCRALGATGPILATDVDQALQDDELDLEVAAGQGRQPDYLLQYPNPFDPHELVFKLVECKGTTSMNYAAKQLARATTQLSTLLVGGRMVQGVAISTVSTDSELSYYAVDPDAPDDSWHPTESDLAQTKQRSPRLTKSRSSIDVDRGDFLSAATATSLGSLAEYAGDPQSAEDWLPTKVARKLPKRSAPLRRSKQTDLGDFIGQEMRITLPGDRRQLRVFQGVARDVHLALGTRRVVEVLEAQKAFAGRSNASITSGKGRVNGEFQVSSVASEGSILTFEVTDR
ncbi:hypothetical protein [Microbacterium arborescens]|uniref:hypothetical protein n=1 Tax=Microbacterium arborescens TaxID=33883 RepID=UPI003C790A6B